MHNDFIGKKPVVNRDKIIAHCSTDVSTVSKKLRYKDLNSDNWRPVLRTMVAIMRKSEESIH